VDAEELTAEEIGELREDHQVLHGKVEDWCSAPACHENWPCTSSRFLASIDSLRTQLAEAQKNADAFEMEWDKALIGRAEAEARETALRESLEEIERIVTTTGGPQLHMIMKIRDAIARALSGEGSNQSD
jgi:hypothetical protein